MSKMNASWSTQRKCGSNTTATNMCSSIVRVIRFDRDKASADAISGKILANLSTPTTGLCFDDVERWKTPCVGTRTTSKQYGIVCASWHTNLDLTARAGQKKRRIVDSQTLQWTSWSMVLISFHHQIACLCNVFALRQGCDWWVTAELPCLDDIKSWQHPLYKKFFRFRLPTRQLTSGYPHSSCFPYRVSMSSYSDLGSFWRVTFRCRPLFLLTYCLPYVLLGVWWCFCILRWTEQKPILRTSEVQKTRSKLVVIQGLSFVVGTDPRTENSCSVVHVRRTTIFQRNAITK